MRDNGTTPVALFVPANSRTEGEASNSTIEISRVPGRRSRTTRWRANRFLQQTSSSTDRRIRAGYHAKSLRREVTAICRTDSLPRLAGTATIDRDSKRLGADVRALSGLLLQARHRMTPRLMRLGQKQRNFFYKYFELLVARGSSESSDETAIVRVEHDCAGTTRGTTY